MPALASAEDLATYLNQDVPTAQSEMVLELASEAVRQAAGQQIDFARTTAVLPVHDNSVFLPQRPVVVDADNPVVVAGYAAGQWRFIPERSMLWLWKLPAINVDTWRTPTSATVTYSHGFTAVPETLRAIVLAAAGRHIGNPEGFASYTVGGMTANWQQGGTAVGTFGLLTEPERQVVRRFFGGSASMLSIT